MTPFPIPKEQQFKRGDVLVCVVPFLDVKAGEEFKALADSEAGNNHTPEAFIRAAAIGENHRFRTYYGYAYRFKKKPE
ncbi:MAG: hypothetical protein PHE38_14340 [Alishewanella agri]|nr:hypothetical protein [Alishewanella agri]